MSENWALAGNRAQRMWLTPCVTGEEWVTPKQEAGGLGAGKSRGQWPEFTEEKRRLILHLEFLCT